VSAFPHAHLLGIEPLSASDIVQVLDLAETFLEVNARPIKKVPTLRGRTVINLFLEPSTRTRTSFEIAAKRLSAESINVTGASSSTTKGETLVDTVKNLDAMHADVIVVRHGASGAAELVARSVGGAVSNAGDGAHEHPTQALLDAFTIRAHKGRLDGLEIAVVGDVAHSRVARSNLWSLTKLGSNVRLCGPATLMPRDVPGMMGDLASRVRVSRSLDEAVEGADVVMMLRIQAERLAGSALFATTREYSRAFGLNATRLARAKPDAIVMHPGPINRGVELDPMLADGPRSVILDQVARGVAVRMACLYLLGLKGLSPELE